MSDPGQAREEAQLIYVLEPRDTPSIGHTNDDGHGIGHTQAAEPASDDEIVELDSKQSKASVDSIVCRICQQSEVETGEPLEETGCSCKGTIRMCHRDCIQNWIRMRATSMCEVCNTPMSYDVLYRLRTINTNPRRHRPSRAAPQPPNTVAKCLCRDSRRTWFMLIFVTLLLAAITSIMMTAFAYLREDFRDGLATDEPPPDEPTLSLCFSISVFCGSIVVAFGGVWLIWELAVWPREQQLVRDIQRWVNSVRAGQIAMEEVAEVRRQESEHGIMETSL